MRREPREGELDAVHRPFHSPLARSLSLVIHMPFISLTLGPQPMIHS